MRFAYLCCDHGIPIAGTLGASVHVRAVVQALRQLGHAVRIFAANPGEPGEGRENEVYSVNLSGFGGESARLFALEELGALTHLGSEFRRLLGSEHAQRTLLLPLTAYRPDVVYERYSLFAYAGVELARELDIPLILEVNAPLAREGAKHRGLILKRTAAEMERQIFVSADALVVVSNEIARHARDLGVPAERITVLPNGVDPRRFDATTSGAEVRRKHELDGKRVVGFVGNPRPWHDLDTVLAAVQRLARHDGSIRLLLVGDAFEREKAALGSLVRAARVASADVAKYLAAMDVVVVPYGKDADTYFSPLKLFEAMAMAKPIVGAAVGQVGEVLSQGRNGLIYEPGNASDLAAKIADLLARPDRGASLGAAAVSEALACHTWDRRARQIVGIASALRARTAPAARQVVR